ncbi:MAG: T9SS type A sorting domain-containing protein [Bacteroidales bacterium]
MKGTKTILSIALMLCVSLLMGQRELPNETKKEISVNKTLNAYIPVKSTDETIIDTIGWTVGSLPEFGSPTLEFNIYGLTGGGYVGGVNTNGYDYWAQCYYLDEQVQATGILAWVALKDNISQSDASILTTKLYYMAEDQAIIGEDQNENPIYGMGPDYYEGTALATKSVTINDLDTSSYADPSLWQYFEFDSPVNVNDNFCIVADFSVLRSSQDTAVLVWDAIGNGLGMGFSQVCRDPNTYYWYACNYFFSFGSGGTLDANLSLFLIVEKGSEVNSNSYFQGMQLTFPNITSDPELVIQFALQNASNTSIDIISVNGQLVKSENLGMKEAGSHHTIMDISDLQPGMYLVSLNSQGSRLIKKLVIE